MLTFLALAVLADAGTLDAGTHTRATIYDSCPEVNFADGGSAPLAFPATVRDGALVPLPADAGGTSDWYMPYPRAQRVSCRIEACIERGEELERWKKPTMQWLVVSAAASAFLGGMALTYGVCTRWPVTCGLQR